MNKTDAVFSKQQKRIDPFTFDDQVADVFPDMLRRSIPGYATSLNMIEMFANKLGQPNSTMYDLGSSLGAATFAMLKGIQAEKIKIFSVDNSIAMIRRSRRQLKSAQKSTAIHLICADIRDIKIKNASLVTLNYTLQFLDPSERTSLINRIYTGLLPGGALLLAEKIAFNVSEEQDFQTEWYYAFKEYNRYSKLEISQKRSALENVLITDSWQTHKNRLQNAGFKNIHLWHRFFSFASIIAIK